MCLLKNFIVFSRSHRVYYGFVRVNQPYFRIGLVDNECLHIDGCIFGKLTTHYQYGVQEVGVT